MTSIQNILKTVQKVLSNPKIYNDQEFFDIPHKKLAIAIIKEKTNLSYKKIGNDPYFKCSWFNIYASCKDAKKYKHILDKIRKAVI